MVEAHRNPTGAAVLPFEDAACCEVRLAGGKGASLARMAAEGLPVPPGFVILAHVLEQSVDSGKLRSLALERDHESLQRLVREARPPQEEIRAGYEAMGGRVAVRSSAAAEDSEAASYAGQQETYLGVEDADEVCARVLDCWASFFSERALFYRYEKGSLEDLGMAVVVQRMIEPEKSGVLFTADPVRRRPDRMVVEAVTGLGERVVSGEVTPDHYVTDRSGAIKREKTIASRLLEEEELGQLAKLGWHLEEIYAGPQDIEWAIADGELYLLQSRPVTTL